MTKGRIPISYRPSKINPRAAREIRGRIDHFWRDGEDGIKYLSARVYFSCENLKFLYMHYELF